MDRPPIQPFTLATATQKMQLAEDAWNTKSVALAYSSDSPWRNRAEFLQGREAIEAFLVRNWQSQLDYRSSNEIRGYREHCIVLRFAHERHDDTGHWSCSHGSENWEFDERGLMRIRHAGLNDAPISEGERRYRWPLGRRPDEHPSLSALGF